MFRKKFQLRSTKNITGNVIQTHLQGTNALEQALTTPVFLWQHSASSHRFPLCIDVGRFLQLLSSIQPTLVTRETNSEFRYTSLGKQVGVRGHLALGGPQVGVRGHLALGGLQLRVRVHLSAPFGLEPLDYPSLVKQGVKTPGSLLKMHTLPANTT